jgi:urease accessory protein
MALGRLAFQRAGAATAISDAYAESPLRFLTPRNHGVAAWAYTSTLGGGLVDGDRLVLEIEVGPGALAFVSSQGPTRVFRGSCASETVARVAAGGALVLVPEPAACFAGARYEQRTSVFLEAGASLASWDVLSAGRERWGFQRFHSALTVRLEGRPLIDEAWLLDPAHGSIAERMGRFGAIGTLLLAGPLFSGISPTLQPVGALVEAASPLGDALLVRLAANSVEEVLHALRTHLSALPALLGDDPWRLHASHAA